MAEQLFLFRQGEFFDAQGNKVPAGDEKAVHDARSYAHKKLEEVLATGAHPHAECRENWALGEFSIWSGSSARAAAASTPPAPTAESVLQQLPPTEMQKLAKLIAAELMRSSQEK